MEKMEIFSVKMCWGNFAFDYVHSDSVGNSGGILCVWDPSSYRKKDVTMSDYFIMIRGVWLKTGCGLLIVSVYAPQELNEKKMLWDYLTHVINNWKGEVIIMGDFNERFEIGIRHDEVVKLRMDVLKSIQDIDKIQSLDAAQKAKIKGDFWIDGTWVDISAKGEIMKFLIILVELELEVSKDEVKRAVWDCGTDKAPGPDGFTFGFYRRFWKVIENDVFDAVNHFFTYGDIPKGCNSSFIALIPKT
ncbi:RNA-directed DNA polymerase, eukaryota, reverse transcriptase zinc-binding domain protein [Tanacetum coccineum]